MLKKLLSVEMFREQVCNWCYCPLKSINQTVCGYILGVHIVINDKSILKKNIVSSVYIIQTTVTNTTCTICM